MVALRSTLKVIPEIYKIINQPSDSIKRILVRISDLDKELSLLEKAIVDDPPATLLTIGIFRSGYSQELDNIIESSKHAREWIANLESVERERTGIKNLKVGYNKVFGYFIEISHSNCNSAPPDYIRKQTLVNAERYITPEMKEYEALVLNAEDHIHEIEVRLFKIYAGNWQPPAVNYWRQPMLLQNWMYCLLWLKQQLLVLMSNPRLRIIER